jgi:hypothetical protein
MAEIRLRLGPVDGARWRLLTPADAMGTRVVLFEIVDESGFEDTLRLYLVPREDGFAIEHVRTLVDPIDLAEPASTLGKLLPLRRALAAKDRGAILRLLGIPREGEVAVVQGLWAAHFHLRNGDLVDASRLLDPLTTKSSAPLVEILTARLALARRHQIAMEKAYARLVARGFDHDGLRLELAQGRLHLGEVRTLGRLFEELDAMGSRLGEVAYGRARFGGSESGGTVGAEAPALAHFATSAGQRQVRIGGASFELPAGFDEVEQKAQERARRESRAPAEPVARPGAARRAMPKVGMVPPQVVEAPDPEEIIRQRMPAVRAWHEEYRQRVAPVKASLGPILGAMRGGELQRLGGACRSLADHLTPLLADPEVFAAPGLDIESDLRLAFYHFQRMAGACLHGRLSEIRSELTKAESKLKSAAGVLARYDLKP